MFVNKWISIFSHKKLYIILLIFDYIISRKNVQNHYERREMSLNKQPPPQKKKQKKKPKTPTKTLETYLCACDVTSLQSASESYFFVNRGWRVFLLQTFVILFNKVSYNSYFSFLQEVLYLFHIFYKERKALRRMPNLNILLPLSPLKWYLWVHYRT